MAEQGTGVKKEFIIEADEKAPVTLQDEPKWFSDIKPKKRVLADIIYEDTGEVAQRRTGGPVKLILRTAVYDDGVLVTKTVGEDNEEYQEYKRSGISMPSRSNKSTAVHKKSSAVEKALAATKKTPAKKAPAKAKE